MNARKLLFLLICLTLLLAACGGPSEEKNTSASIPSALPYEGKIVEVVSFEDHIATIVVDGVTEETYADVISYHRFWVTDDGITYDYSESTTSNSRFEPSLIGVLGVSTDNKVILHIEGIYTPTPADLVIAEAWPTFLTQATNPHQFLYAGLDPNATSPLERCHEMVAATVYWPNLTVPDICRANNPHPPRLLGGTLIADQYYIEARELFTCEDHIGERYIIKKIENKPQTDGYILMKYPLAVTLYDNMEGTSPTVTLPARVPLGFIPQEYEEWASPQKISWFILGTVECESDQTHIPLQDYQPTITTKTITVPNERYNSPGCILYRTLGGAGSPNNPNWDPQCESPTREETVTIP